MDIVRRLLFAFVVTGALLAQTPTEVPSTYTLGPDDQVSIRALDLEVEWPDKPLGLDSRGNINLPMIGRVKASGLTLEELEGVITEKLKEFVKEPQVTATMLEFRSQPVSILGAVTTPGVHQLQGRKTLFEMISMAGGLKPEAGYQIKITRRVEWGRLPLPDAKDDASGRFSIASVGIKSVMDASNPGDNIEIKPNDVISVPKGNLVYVIGTVKKPGGFVLGERENITAVQVLALAEGFERFADSRHVRIMRTVAGSTTRTEIPLDLKGMLDGKVADIPLQAEDILVVPTSARKSATVRGLETALGMGSSIGTGMVIYRR